VRARIVQRRLANEISVKNMRFDAALRNMSQGLSMFDKDERLVVANARYAEIYGYPPELARSGTAVDELIGNCVARGLLRAEAQTAARERRSQIAQQGGRATSSWIEELTDERIIRITQQ